MRKLKNTLEEFGVVAKFMHWFMAFAIIGMLIVGFIMADMAPSSLKWTAYTLHKSTGVLLMMLLAFRLVWRLSNPTPQLTITGVKGIFSRLSVYVLYAAMATMVFSGFVMSDAGRYTINFFNLFILPYVFEESPELSKFAGKVHANAAFALVGFLFLHVSAAFYHHLVLKDTVLMRMLPKKRG